MLGENMRNFESLKIPRLTPTWPRNFFIFTLFIFIFAGAFLFGLNYLNNEFKKQISKLDTKINLLKEVLPLERQMAIVLLEQKLDNLPKILANHVHFSKLLTILESLTHPQIYFESLKFSQENQLLVLEGIAPNHNILAEAISGFINEEEKFTNVLIKNIRLNPEGKLSFVLEISFRPELIKH